MRRCALIAIVAGAMLVVLPVQAAPRWRHWQGRYFSCFVPAGKWRVVESANGIEISSPTGDAVVSFAYATNAPGPVSLEQVERLALGSLGLTGVRLLRVGAPYAVPGGEQEELEFRQSGGRCLAWPPDGG